MSPATATVAADPSEVSPLLKATDSSPPSDEQLPALEDTSWTRDGIRTAILATVFLVLFAFADLLKYISTIRLIELGVCREHYLENDPSFVDGNGNVPEYLCKSPEIQQDLAHLRGYLSALESIVGLVLAIPYGLLVGRMGERLLVGINVIGYLLCGTWRLVVCSYWSTFPPWTIVLSPLLRVVGGGSPFMSSLVYSIAAKHVPAPKRSAPLSHCSFGFEYTVLIVIIGPSFTSFF